jgi:uncharacterized protein (TIGR01777 family)
MHIFITGGLGFIGSHLTQMFLDAGHRVTATGTRLSQQRIDHDQFRYLSADTTEPGPWQEAAADAQIVVNLAGAPIFKRWSRRTKTEMVNSRILTTQNVVAALGKTPDATLLSASAIGYYGDRGETVLEETAEAGSDFLADLSVNWEKEALEARKKSVRVVLLRFGVVLDPSGGAMAQMIPAFRSFAGGPLGTGRQWFAWIHMDDVLGAVRFLLDHPQIQGPVNITAPNPIRQKDFATALGRSLHRPALLPTPGPLIRIALGEFANALLASQRVMPHVLLEHGYDFKFPSAPKALQNVAEALETH